MNDHSQFSDEEFLSVFRSCELEEKLFSHEAHLRLAWLNIKALGIDEAIVQTKRDILAFVNHLGAQHIYNETVTVAAVKIIHHFENKSASTSFSDLIAEFPRLKGNFKDLLAQHYSADILILKRRRKDILSRT